MHSHKSASFIVALTLLGAVQGLEPPKARNLSASPSALWHDRGDAKSLNILDGSGGAEHRPVEPLTFVKEEDRGTSPKFEVVDANGVRWKAKVGEESRSETATTRLIWAAGYYTDDDYYLANVRVVNLPKLRRGGQFVSKDGVVQGMRLERKDKSSGPSTYWSWYHNAYSGTREMDGLRVLMALVNNWDLKEVNNSLEERKGEEPRYLVSDLGATLGKTGNTFMRTKSNLGDFRSAKFVQQVRSDTVDFHLNSRPFFLTIFHLPNYVQRTRMQGIVKQIPRAHARWVGDLLGQLTPEQVRDCFRAGGYSPEEVEGFALVVESRIADLRKL